MIPTTESDIIIVGGGLVGALLAGLLAKRGFQVEVFEKRPDPRKSSLEVGRSINLALSHRGWQALEKVGLAEKVRQEVIPMKGRKIHNQQGQLAFQPYGKEGQAIYSVSRNQLNQLLITHAETSPNARFHFGQPIQEVDLASSSIVVGNGSGQKKAISRLLIGADGAFSMVRLAMMRSGRFNYSQHYIEHGYKELTIPPSASGGCQLDPNALHIWPRERFMLIALPNMDCSFTATLFLPFEGSVSFEALQKPDEVHEFFSYYFPDTLTLMPDLESEFFQNPTSSLVTVRCEPWHFQDKVLLIGDAAHAIVPFYGQGMNAGFEDCRILDDLIETMGEDWKTILPHFAQKRKPNADAISELALQNFVEMRDKVSNPDFLLQKSIEQRLQELFPEKWKPLYSMVTFSDIPYATALETGQHQDAIMRQLLKQPRIREEWQQMDLAALPEIKEYLNQ